MSSDKHKFSVVDIIIFAISLCISCAIGLFFALKSIYAARRERRRETNVDLILGGRDMPLIPTTLSLMSSVVSGILILAYPAEIYVLGTSICWSAVGCGVSLIFTAFFFVPVIHRSVKSVSAYQYFQDRFNSRIIRLYASALFTMSTLVYMSVVLYAPAIALSGVTTIPTWVLILVVGVLCTVYTSIGGLKAVVWTDAIQAVIMYAGLIAMVVSGTMKVGSVSDVWEINRNRSRISGFTNTDPNPFQYMTVWTAGIGGFFYWLNTWAVNQMSLQRYCSMKTQKQAQTLVFLTIPCIGLISVLAFYMGLTMFAYYDTLGCDPLKSKQIDSKDQLVMFFMIELFSRYRGLPGLFLACLFSGTLSTVSSGVNSLSAVGWQEFVRPCLGERGRNDRVATITTKVIGAVYGLTAIGLAFLAEPLGGIFQAVNAALGAIGGPLTGLMILGIFVPFANKWGSMVGMIVGTILSMWVFIGAQIMRFPKPALPVTVAYCNLSSLSSSAPNIITTATPVTTTFLSSSGASYSYDQLTGSPTEFSDIYKLSFFMYAVVGIVPTIVLGVLISLCTGRSNVFKSHPELFAYYYPGRSGADGSVDHEARDEPATAGKEDQEGFIDFHNDYEEEEDKEVARNWAAESNKKSYPGEDERLFQPKRRHNFPPDSPLSPLSRNNDYNNTHNNNINNNSDRNGIPDHYAADSIIVHPTTAKASKKNNGSDPL